ncbi:uncharacterized protein LOC124366777 [Homalodisca vitripennis]|uniref:uncharacterized protein LOC124366777 n=1 Tax=Homalodisca vitripennis TaxID=197043 RepID=UPI001EE9B7CF|nr:uncharacterized protein LOC124366777 [Homalodisca vitripennis]
MQPDLPVKTLCVLVRLNPLLKILIFAVYITPRSPTGIYSLFAESLTETISTCHNFDAVLITGDFNFNGFNWINPDLPVAPPPVRVLLGLASQLDLSQISDVLNVRGVQLDLIFGPSDLFIVSLEDDPLLASEPCHPALGVTSVPSCPMNSRADHPTYIRNTRRCNLEAVRCDLQHGITRLDYNCNDVNLLFSSFWKQLVGPSVFPRWFSKELKELVILKKILHKRLKRSHDEMDYRSFCRIRECCRNLFRECRASYVGYVNSTISSNVNVFWSFVNDLNRTYTTPYSLRLGNIEVSTHFEMCELFATYFSSVYTPASSEALPVPPFNTSFVFSDCSVSLDAIHGKLVALDSAKGYGPDEVTPGVLKFCHSELAPLLCFLFNHSLSTGIFHDALKDGFVIPMIKSGDCSDATNYRPIVIQSVLSKVFESLILDMLQPLFKHVIIDEQHGFLAGRSTETNLLSLQCYVMDAFSRRNKVDAV